MAVLVVLFATGTRQHALHVAHVLAQQVMKSELVLKEGIRVLKITIISIDYLVEHFPPVDGDSYAFYRREKRAVRSTILPDLLVIQKKIIFNHV